MSRANQTPPERRFRLLVWPCLWLMVCGPAKAAPRFDTFDLNATNAFPMLCDLNGDGLTDLVLVNGLTLAIYPQDAVRGFSHEPQQTYQLPPHPCFIWPGRLGGTADRLLLLTSAGISSLQFTNGAEPPGLEPIIQHPTVVPESATDTNAVGLSWSAATGGDWPLLLLPTAEGLQVWRHQDHWAPVQVISDGWAVKCQPLPADRGYQESLWASLDVGDLNGDGRDDLMLCETKGGTNIYRLFRQQTNGLFAPEPSLTYADEAAGFSWHGWTDLNRDGHPDLVKGVWLNEASFLPGVPAAKVMIYTYVADAQGRLPTEPQQVFRKDDWTPAVPLVDIDGDGLPDLVLGYHQLENKDNLIKEITTRTLNYKLRIFFRRADSGYPATADCERNVIIHLDHNENPMDWTLPNNFTTAVKLGGDFMGDGRMNLLVRDHADTLSVYPFISRARGFSEEPVLRFSCPEPIDGWQVADLNHDGISDLIVKLASNRGYRVFISRRPR